jgi:GH15 family glucan-1,4-alpha-glucosidase
MLPIHQYALIGDLHTAALVGSDGSVDWLCLPRFDSQACFAALLGTDRHGHWRIGPADGAARVRRRYRPDTLVLETEFTTTSGTARLTDAMPPRDTDPVLVRVAEGVSGTVDLRMTLAPAFEYGSAEPTLRRQAGGYRLAAGSQALWLFGPAHVRRLRGVAAAEFTVGPGDKVPFALVSRDAWDAGREPPGPPLAAALIEAAERWWRGWVGGLSCEGEWREPVIRSLITLKALTYAPTGAVVAAPTTSLPQQASGGRNWDYRYCWLRDAAAAVRVLLRCGALDEAVGLVDWMSRAAAGPPSAAQALYGVTGEQRLPEIELGWLPGHDGARPVRVGNAAAAAAPLGVFGDMLAARLAVRMAGLDGRGEAWDSAEVLGHLEAAWREPDAGFWEARGPARQFVHSKVMAWAAADAAVKMIERFGDPGPAGRWRRLRAQIKADVLARGYDTGAATFVTAYERTGADASLLRLAALGFLPAGDERLRGTASAVAARLDRAGVLRRGDEDPAGGAGGPPRGDGGHLPATFWLAQCAAAAGRGAEAREIFARLLDLRNDVGLLAEEYDPLRGRLAGNYPLTASHLALAETAAALDAADGHAQGPGPRRPRP